MCNLLYLKIYNSDGLKVHFVFKENYFPNSMKDKKDRIILGLSISLGLVILISTGVIIYLISSNSINKFSNSNNFMRGNFTFNNETLSQTESFFASATSQGQINSYCSQSGTILYCREYCTRINPSDSFCSGISVPSGMGAPPQ